jgi:hypothetical protein
MSDNHIPSHIRGGIIYTRYNLGNVELTSHHLDHQGARADLTPTADRTGRRLLKYSNINDFYYMDCEGARSHFLMTAATGLQKYSMKTHSIMMQKGIH